MRRLLRLYPEEIPKTVRFAALSFLWSFAASAGVTFFDGVFLEVIGAEWLPRAYGYISLSLMLISVLLFRALQTISLERIALLTQLAVMGVQLISLGIYFTVPASAFYLLFALKVFATSAYAALSITFWSFIDQYYDLQDAKRIYTLVMAAIFLGAILSGTYISQLSPLIGIGGMLTSIALALSLGGALTLYISAREQMVHDELEDLPGKKSYSIASWVSQVTSSSFALFLIAINILAQLLWNVTEFNYFTAFSTEFALEPSYKLTTFLGSIKAGISVANVLFMLFGYSRLIHRIGLNRSVLIPFALFAALYAVWLPYPSFAVAVAGIIILEGALFTIEDNNFNLLLGIIPAKVKRSLRVFIEAFVEPLGILIAAGLLTSESKSIFIGGILSVLAVATAYGLMRSYRSAVLDNLRSKTLNLNQTPSEVLAKLPRRERRRIALRALSGELDPGPALDSLIALGNVEGIADLLSGIDRFSESDQRSLLSALLTSTLAKRPEIKAAARRIYKKDSLPELKILLALNQCLPHEDSLQLVESSDPRACVAGILSLEAAAGSDALSETYTLRSMAAFALQRLLASSAPEDLSMGLFAQGFMNNASDLHLVLPYLSHEDRSVQLAAALSTTRLISPEQSDLAAELIHLLPKLEASDVRLQVIEAIGKSLNDTLALPFVSCAENLSPIQRRSAISALSSGAVSAAILLELTGRSQLNLKARLLTGKALAHLNPRLLKQTLRTLIIPEIMRAQAYAWHAYHIRKNEDLSLLAEAMEGSLNHLIDFIIGLLAAAGSIEESELITYSLRSGNEKTQAQGIETLEKAADRKIFRLLEPLVDDRPIEEKIRRLPSHAHQSIEGVLELLENSPLTADRLIAWHTRAKLKIGDWRARALGREKEHEAPIVDHFVSQLLSEESR
jgi:hypothetical protein